MNYLFNFHSIDWREPLWLLVALQPLVIFLIKNLSQKNNLTAYADKKLQPWLIFPAVISITAKSILNTVLSKNSAYLLAWLLFSIAMAGPRIPISKNTNEQILGANIMLVVDLSRSMKATDIEPNRLRRAKIEINEFLEKAQNHRIGITVFSARAHLFVPLTSDHLALKTYLKMLDDLTFPTLGSDPVAAIMLAKNELQQFKGKSAIILVTDGDFSSPLTQKHYSQLDSLKKANIPLYILGAGTVEGEAVQLADGGWLKYKQQAVISKMEEKSLKNLANRFDGKYSAIYDDNSDWNTLYDQGISQYNSISDIDSKQYILWRELYIYFLIPALFLFILALTPYQFKALKNTTATLLFSLVFYSFPNNDAIAFELFSNTEKEAYTAYTKENYQQAEKLYQNLSGYISYFGRGNSLYKMGHYQKARSQFIQALLNSKTDTQRANALFNLANSHFRTGDFSSAISSYQDALRYQPENKASIYNINISQVLKKNIELRQKEMQALFASPRQGKGPRSANSSAGSDIGENTSVSVGDSSNKLNQEIPLPDLPDLNEDTIKKLLLSGLDNIKLAENNELRFKSSSSPDKDLNLIKAKLQLDVLTDSPQLLWKRIFEIEEGFPAPVDTPHTLPGVKPW
ncbi:MAG: hypothetical protein BMS9Abin31_0155 [Gammaproteobacteria bacterium]|nr:MAG: hypothetical protein BMS9Abin31_0155 [Gammaproteobacteria bacterium]